MLPPELPALAPPADLLGALLDLTVSGVVLYTPVLDATGEIADFAFAYLNPAARQQLRLPAQPATTYLRQFPGSREAGIWEFHRAAYLAGGETRELSPAYQADGYDGYYRVAARRVGEALLVSFSETKEPALRASQAREQAARAEAERQRGELQRLLEQAPVAIAVFRGPQHVVELANELHLALWGRTRAQMLGRPVFEAIPEAAGQGFEELLAGVLATGQPYVAHELPAKLQRHGGAAEEAFFNFVYQPLREPDGRISGVMVVATEATGQVRARRQADTLQAAMLAVAQRQVQQREELFQVFEQTPAAVALLREPNHRFEYANPAYQAQFPGQPLRGRLLLEAHPDAAASGALACLDHVYKTGETYMGEEQPVELTLLAGQPAETRYFNFTYQPYREQGRIVGVSIVAYDVTRQVRARRAVLQQLEARVRERTQELQAAQATAERERALLQALLTQAPVAIALFQGEEVRVTAANPMMATLWGYAPEQVLNRPLLEGVPELRGQGFDDLLRQVLATRVPVVGTETPATMLRNGALKTTYYNFVYQPLYDAEGSVLGVIDVAVEVTEQVEARRRIEQLNQEAQAARAEAERQRGELERVFEQAPVAIAVYRGPTYTIELANPTVARLWGRTQAQLIGKGLFEALPEVAGLGFEELLAGVTTTGQPYVAHGMEARHERNGHLETVYWDFVYVPTYAADGRLDGAMVVATDATAQVLARRQMEQLNEELETRVQERTRQLLEQQSLLRQILGQVPAAIATLGGPEHHYSFFNELYQAQVGHRAALGRPVAEALPEIVGQGYLDLLDQVYRTGELYEGREVPFQLHDPVEGRSPVHYLNFVYQPLADKQGRTTGILVFALDVTEQVLARQLVEEGRQQVQALNEELAAINAELRTSNTQLTRTNTDLDTFVYTASHDLKAPITNIEGLLEALRDYLPAAHPEPMVPYLLGLMQGAVTRFLQTIGQLTDVSRLQHATQEPAEPVDLAALVEDIRLDLDPLLTSTQGQLLAEVAACPTVLFAPKNLRSILYNLFSNGLKYRSPERAPVVRLLARCTPGRVELAVHDNGLGLSETQQAKLFVLFQRLHTHVEGSGVGLYMLKRIVDNAEGTIAVRSEPGVGTTFTVTLPQRAA